MRNKQLLFLTFLLLVSANTFAQIQVEFTPRYNESLNGDFTTIANNMLSRHATNAYNGIEDNHDFQDNVYVDIDNDDSTFNSSSANFTNPIPNNNCVTVEKAYLYWAAADKETDSGEDNQPNWNFDDIKLMLPGETSYTTLTAEDVIFRGRDSHFSNDPYVCFKDITDAVVSLNDVYGTYQVANVETKDGTLIAHGSNYGPGVSGGWQIVFVYKSAELPAKNVTIFDGYTHVTTNVNDFDINFSGFQTIPSGDVSVRVLMGCLEGDRALNGDRLQIINAVGNYVDMTAPLRNSDNFFNSRITVNNNEYLDRNPASSNTFGFDAAVFNLDNTGNSIITNNQTSATIRLTSTDEVYGLYALGLAVEVWQPDLNPLPINLISGVNPAQPDDVIGVNFTVQNTGNDDAINVAFTSILPPQVSLVPPTTLPEGVSYTYDETTNELIFSVEDGYVNVGDQAIDINFDVTINNECYFLEDDCDLSADIQFIATYNGVISTAQESTTTSTSDTSACGGIPLTVNIVQPIVNWETLPNALDQTIECDNTTAINDAQNLSPVPDKCEFTLIKTSGNFVANTNCPSSGTYTNSWNFTDACGVIIADYVQTITIIDTTLPTASNLNDVTLECIEDIPNPDTSIVTDADDNCSTPIIEFVSDQSDGNSCSETIIRTYSVTDSCGNFIEVTQTFSINDNITPTLTSNLTEELTIVCEDIPAIPDLEFEDNCTANVQVDFTETIAELNAIDYDIYRTWVVTDDCDNQDEFTQTIYVRPEGEVFSETITACIEDESINLNEYLSFDNDADSGWEGDIIELTEDGVLDPRNTPIGNYTLQHTRVMENSCEINTNVVLTIHDDCVDYSCVQSETDVDISKMITPNNDGYNDQLEVFYTINENSVDQCDIIIEISIYNRWGTKVYQSDNYQNDWSGNSPNAGMGSSNYLPTGTYFYVVTLKNSSLKPIQGYIYLGSD